MKKTAMLIAVFSMLVAGASVSYAESKTFTPDQCPVVGYHRVFDDSNSIITGCIPNSTWDANIAASITAQGDKNLKAVASGATVTDDHGIDYTCSNYWACVDTPHTDDYRQQMQAIARALKGLVLSTHRFDGWIASLK